VTVKTRAKTNGRWFLKIEVFRPSKRLAWPKKIGGSAKRRGRTKPRRWKRGKESERRNNRTSQPQN